MYKVLLIWSILLGSIVVSAPIFADETQSTAIAAQSTSTNPSEDPFQGFNRAMFSVHNVIDGVLLEPMANIYQDGVPAVVQNRIGCFLNNVTEPWTLINDGLQGEGEKGIVTVCRFMINTVFGLLGTFDVASKLGLDGHRSNFGQTLGTWGVPQGPYIFVPILGPTTLRSLTGFGVGFFANPYSLALRKARRDDMLWATIIVDGLVKRADNILIINDLRENSFDYYVAMRSSFLQYEAGRLPNQQNNLQPNPEEFLSD